MTVTLQLVRSIVAAAAEPAATSAAEISTTRELFIQFCYLAASVLFIFGLRGLTAPDKARRGMQLAAVGMLVAIVGTLIDHRIIDYTWIVAGLILGSGIGAAISIWMPMTAVPQRTAISHAFGALAATLVGIAHYDHLTRNLGEQVGRVDMAALGFEVMFGSLTITGSFMAFGKLQEILPSAPITYKFQNATNIGLFFLALLMFVFLVVTPSDSALHATVFYLMVLVGLAVGVLIVIPIGGADMPVVISLLNSYAGLAASGHRLRPGQQRADHRRRARRGLGLLPLDPDEPGHEPFVHQRAVRRVRRHDRKSPSPRRPPDSPCTASRSRTPPCSWPTPAL